MIKVNYTELDGPYGPAMRLEAAGHAGYAPAGQDIVCAGVSTLMQALVSLLAGEENAHSDAFDEPDGPRLTVTAARPCTAWVEGAFELAKAGFALLAALGGYHNHTVGTTRTIDSRGGSIFQHLDRFDIRRAQLIQAYHDRNTVHDIHRFVVGLQRTISTYPNTGLFTRFRAGLHDRNTGGTSL